MKAHNSNALPAFAQKAATAFQEIMSTAHKNQMEHINRGNKGELFVLKHLNENEQAMSPSQLSQALDSSTARISALLKALEQKEEIERQVDKDDRRFVLVNITKKGRERAVEELFQMKENLAQVFATLGADDTREFLRLTALFSNAMKAQMDRRYP